MKARPTAAPTTLGSTSSPAHLDSRPRRRQSGLDMILPRAPLTGESSDEFCIDDADFVWDSEVRERANARARERMPTLPDEDPLRYDLVEEPSGLRPRDALPTLPDTDPLRHDSDAPAALDGWQASFDLRRRSR